MRKITFYIVILSQYKLVFISYQKKVNILFVYFPLNNGDNLGQLLGRFLRIIAWLAPFYQFRASVWRKCGVKVGKGVYIGNLVYFDGEFPHYITLEDEVSVGPSVLILAHSGASPFHQRTGIFYDC